MGKVRIDEDGDEDLSGLNVGLVLKFRADGARQLLTQAMPTYEALIKILRSGQGHNGVVQGTGHEFWRGTRTGEFTTEGNARRLVVGKVIQGEIVPVPGHKGEEIVVKNTRMSQISLWPLTRASTWPRLILTAALPRSVKLTGTLNRFDLKQGGLNHPSTLWIRSPRMAGIVPSRVRSTPFTAGVQAGA